MIKKILAILCLCSSAWATTSVTGNLKTLGTGSISLGTFVRFYLRGCSGNQPRINGTGLIGPTLGNVYFMDFVPNSSGAIVGTLYSNNDAAGTGNGEIECGGLKTGTWYGMVAFLNGKAGPETPIIAKNTATIDISNVTPLTANPVVASPTGDTTYARLDGGNMPFTGAVQTTLNLTTAGGTTLAPTGNLLVGGGSPWFDITAAPWNAKCDGSTDDTTAINNAFTAAKTAGGGYVFVPSGKTCVVAGQLNCDSCTNVVLKGFSGWPWTPNAYLTPLPLLKFTGSTSPLISFRSAQGVGIEGVNLQQTNAAFTGLFITTEHVNANDSQGIFFRFMSVAGTASSANSTCLLCLDKSDDIEISHVSLEYAVNAIRGMAAGGSYSFTVNINNNSFSTGTGTISGAMIINPGGGWIIGPNNDFEMGTALGNPNVVDCTTACSVGLVFRDNFVGDTTAGWTGTVLKNIGASSGGYTIQGNEITGASTGNFISFASAATGIIVTGNFISTFSTCLSFASNNQIQVTVIGNNWQSCTTFQSGAPRGQGLIQDNTNKYIFYGAISIDNAVGSIAPAATNQVPLGAGAAAWSNAFFNADTLVEGAAPSGTSAQDVCYGDSTAHAIKCSYNNGTFTPLVTALGATSQKAETGSADANVLTYTPPATIGTYNACFNASVSSATSGVIAWTLSYKNSNGVAQTNDTMPLFQQGTAAPNVTFTTSAAGEYQGCWQFDVDNSATAIVVKWVGGGTTAAKVSATVTRLQ